MGATWFFKTANYQSGKVYIIRGLLLSGFVLNRSVFGYHGPRMHLCRIRSGCNRHLCWRDNSGESLVCLVKVAKCLTFLFIFKSIPYNGYYHQAVPVYRKPLRQAEKEQQQDLSKVPGKPGIDYPLYHTVPETSFSCHHVPAIPGIYANVETGCQVMQQNGTKV